MSARIESQISIAIPQGQDWVIVPASLSFDPVGARAYTMSGSIGAVISAVVDLTTLSRSGGTFNLTGAPIDNSQILVAKFYGYTDAPYPCSTGASQSGKSSPNLIREATILIPEGDSQVTLTGLDLGFIPVSADGWTESDGAATVIVASADATTLSKDGATFNLSGAPIDDGQRLVARFYGYSSALPPYSWTPESGTALSNGRISGLDFEQSLMNNLAEFLSGYFTDASHTVFGAPKLFPLISLRFQQGQTPQPLEGAYIRTVLSNSGSGVQEQYGGYWRTRQTVGLEFWIHAAVKAPRPDGWNQDYLCRNVSDCLYALLLDRGASIPLQANGFRKIRPTNPAVVYDPMYSTRRIRCSMTLWFDTPASGGIDSTLGGDN